MKVEEISVSGQVQEKGILTYALLPFRLLFKLYFGVYFFLTLFILYPAFYFLLSKEKWFPLAFKLKRFWAVLLQIGFLSGFSRKVKGKLPDGPFIICSNHTSYLDIIMMYRAFPRYFIFMGKEELTRWPLFNIFFKKMDITVNRSSSSSAARAFIRAKRILAAGDALVIFPEGTIPDNPPQMKHFKSGAFKLAIEMQVPIVPVTFLTNWRMLSNADDLFGSARPGISKVIIHEAIPTKGLTREDLVPLQQSVFDKIDQTLKARWK